MRTAWLLLVAACAGDDGGGGGGQGMTAAHAFCIEETNRYRTMNGRPAVAYSMALEDYANEGARVDHNGSPHQHFSSTNGGGIAFAENECPRWNLNQSGGDTSALVGECIAAFCGGAGQRAGPRALQQHDGQLRHARLRHLHGWDVGDDRARLRSLMWTVEHGMVVRRYGDGPEVIWIHGLGEMSASFDAIVRHPLLAGFTHVLPDLPGYGRSRWPNVVGDGDSLDALADQLATWQTGQRPILVGHSMGGVLATLVAERIAVSGIVDIDGNLSRGDCTFSAEGAAYDLPTFLAHGWAAMRDAVYARGVGERALRGYHAGMVLASPAVFHRNATDLVALSSTEALAPRLAAVAGGKLRTTTGPVPVLFVAGAPGGVCARSRELLAAHAVPTVALEPSGHWPYIDQPDAFAAAIAPVLREAAASRGA